MNKLLLRWQIIRRNWLVRIGVLAVLLILLLMMGLRGISSGAVDVPNSTIRDVIADKISERLHLDYRSDLDYSDRLIGRDAALIWDSRLPRVVLAALIGAALGMAGAALQGVFRSPLLEPGLVGISSGGAAGAITAIILGFQFGDSLTGERSAQALFAFIGGLLVTFFVYRATSRNGRTDSIALVLVGLVINAILAAYVGMATFLASEAAAKDITFWTLGSLANTFWRDVYLIAPFVGLGMVILPFCAKPLNLIAMGDSDARNLGVAVDQLRTIILGVSALMVGISVAVGGVISFVGLIVPHLIRLLFGPDHRLLLPASGLGGAAFLVTADLLARTLTERSEIPLGVITTLVGGPLFLMLVLSTRRGW